MLITKISALTGIKRTKEINCTLEQLRRWENGELIQKVMPQLSPSDREFIITGCTDEEFDILDREY